MTGASLKYLIKEGFRNTWTNRMMSIASICVLMSCLVLIGSASMIFLNIDSLLGKIEEENVIMVYIADDATPDDITNMQNEITACGNIKSVEFISKESAWQEQLNTMEKAQAEFFTQISSDIPLPNAYKVTVENLDKFDETVNKLKKIQHVDTIRENKNLAKKLVALRQGIRLFPLLLSQYCLLFLFSLFQTQLNLRFTAAV